MPPTPPKARNARYAAYTKPDKKIATVPKSSAPMFPLSPSSPLSRLSENPPPSEPYVIDFGTHKGKLLAEVSKSWISWVKGKILNGGFEEPRYDDLRDALRHWIDLETSSEPETLGEDHEWNPPPLGFAPSTFHEEGTCQPLCISGSQIGQYFELAETVYENLPTIGGMHDVLLTNNKKRYYLLHVYDWVKTHSSEAEADAALEKFLRRNDPEMYGMLGFEVSEYYW
ncbi:hypothetical protein DL98DRAFT_569961 [Cadophora sp. DSE1049]|nr:hypothetical protein DL98DRAFT_569961 [Cadophora sp. DSE1049]